DGMYTIIVAGPPDSDPDFVLYRRDVLLEGFEDSRADMTFTETAQIDLSADTYVLAVADFRTQDRNDPGTNLRSCLTVSVTP
ncbi:MAG: hypothetical protein MJA83_04280, partial [Gammaproteobacteria bacterium]|nr:hypothetical protein [Gammaproteobacteria bacterium]